MGKSFFKKLLLLTVALMLLVGCSGDEQPKPVATRDIPVTTEPSPEAAGESRPTVTPKATKESVVKKLFKAVTPELFKADTPKTFSRLDDLYAPALAAPDFSKIELAWMGDGFTRVTGSAGAIPGRYPVYVVSPNTANAALTKAGKDGSFNTQIVAPPGSWVIVKYDPTGGDWLHSDILEDDRPSGVNAAIGAMAQVPFDPPKGDGVPFVISGSTQPGHLDFTFKGSMGGAFEAGGEVTFKGHVTAYVAKGSAPDLVGERLDLHTQLTPLFDSKGQPRIMANQFFSTILTPSKLPIEHWSGLPLSGGPLQMEPFQLDEGGSTLTAPFTFEIHIPKEVADGVYTVWLDTGSGIGIGSLGGPRPHVNPFMTNHALPFPPFTIGSAVPSHLIWTLLTDVPSSDGSRGSVAAGDLPNFQIANRIATQAHHFIIPRLSKTTGEEVIYRLEPYLPMVAHGDRYIPNVPNIAFKFPSGGLTVRVTRPDGTVDELGPAPFITAATRTPASGGGLFLDSGGGHLAEVLQLSTGSGSFDYQFPTYGEYTIEMVGDVDDIYGNSYQGGGLYTIFVAEPLDIEPATLPMTPFEVGDVLNPGLTLLPGVPAEVDVKTTLYVESDPDRLIEQGVTGTANRFGVFTPPLGTNSIEMNGPGELLVETTARYTDSDGVLWMGATRWGQVVAPKDSPFLAHGRRGRDSTPIDGVKLWFNSPQVPGDSAHVNLPFANGDIAWQTDDDAGRVIITAQDTEGLVTSAIRSWESAGYHITMGDHGQPPPTLEQRIQNGELPLSFVTKSGMNPALVPEDIVSYGYWYGGIQRPGERVREIISDDDNGTGYWRFGEMYGLQPGMGSQGDLPNDFKFQFGGAVFRDTTRNLNRYGIYGSLWVLLPNDDPIGSRVFPPFQGINGGPSGGPILTLGGEDIDAFVVPLAVRPGTILESGDTFSFSAQLAPTLPGRVDVTISNSGEIVQTISGRANEIGYYYDPSQDFLIETPGTYHVTVTATFDSPTSAGPMSEPFPTGTVLGAVEGGFDIYVVPGDSPTLNTDHPKWSVMDGDKDVTFSIISPNEQQGVADFTIGMPGHLLHTGTVDVVDGRVEVVYSPLDLSKRFPNIDVLGRTEFGPGLADTIWVNVLLKTDSGGFYARQFTLQGPDLLIPP
ncbi:MAG: hypothetical protein DK304_000472 [Chloroflexi bacterium]|jgi:hypothetical protein|nr:MAG: hypothetical protein DK304_000472 [Chloroflexota bacterium]